MIHDAQHTPADGTRFAWQPNDEVRRRARLTEFMIWCGVDSYDELQRRSVEDVAWFTEQLLRFLDVRFDPPYERILDLGRGLQWPRWCVGGGLNISEACLDRHLGVRPDQPAIIWEGEEGATRSLTYAQLTTAVEQCAAGLRSLGLGRGDAVGLHLPMVPETAIALLALARIGAIAVPLFSGFGPDALETRLHDVDARALFTFDAFPRRGKLVSGKEVADRACASLATLRHMIVVPRAGQPVPLQPGRDLDWDTLLLRGRQRLGGGAGDGASGEGDSEGHGGGGPGAGVGADEVGGELGSGAERTAAEDPLIVIYSSGTTGRPKGILHSHCGFPIKAAQDMAFGTDVGPGTRITWVTDIGWMMGPWLLYGALILGGTVVLYDGAPDYPGADQLWRFCEKHDVEVLGISPTLVRALMPQGDAALPASSPPGRLRILASTGEPWNPDPWWWLFQRVGGGRIPIINASGGTEISGCIVMGNPLLPVKPCGFAAACPGIDAEVLDDQARPVRGTVGELVIRRPWIGMARGFWRDPERYLETYWSRWPDVWVHGDWAVIDDDGHWFILGRSDDTLKVAGKRIGPAEVESVLVADPAVVEAAVIGVPDERTGTAMVAFCVTAGPPAEPERLAKALRERVGEALGKPLRPSRVVFVPALPKTRNAKVMRRVIRAAWLGQDPGDLSSLENPAAAEGIARAAASQPAASHSAGPAHEPPASGENPLLPQA